MDTSNHTHVAAILGEDFPFFAPVTRNENRAAHGGIFRVEECSCGATRRVNINGRSREESSWAVFTDPGLADQIHGSQERGEG